MLNIEPNKVCLINITFFHLKKIIKIYIYIWLGKNTVLLIQQNYLVTKAPNKILLIKEKKNFFFFCVCVLNTHYMGGKKRKKIERKKKKKKKIINRNKSHDIKTLACRRAQISKTKPNYYF